VLQEALAAAAGVAIDGFADDGVVIPAERVQVETSVWNAAGRRRHARGIEVAAPAGWKVERLDPMTSPVPTELWLHVASPSPWRPMRHGRKRTSCDGPGRRPVRLERRAARMAGIAVRAPALLMTVRLTIAGQCADAVP